MSQIDAIASDASEAKRPEAGFAAMMREGTMQVHREAERSGFIADLIRNRATRHGYALFLRNLVPAYDALERALLPHIDTAILSAFADPRLRRLPSLITDIEAIEGIGWAATLPASACGARLCRRDCGRGRRHRPETRGPCLCPLSRRP